MESFAIFFSRLFLSISVQLTTYNISRISQELFLRYLIVHYFILQLYYVLYHQIISIVVKFYSCGTLVVATITVNNASY